MSMNQNAQTVKKESTFVKCGETKKSIQNKYFQPQCY